MNRPPIREVSKGRVYLFSFLAYASSLIDDSPVNADQFLGPRYQLEAEAILHVLTILFLFLALREASTRVTLVGGALTTLAFVVSSLDDFPELKIINYMRRHHWYLLDVTIHVASVLIFYFAIREALLQSATQQDASRSS